MPFHTSEEVRRLKREMKSFIKEEKKKGAKVNMFTGEIKNPTKKQKMEFNKRFTTEKPLHKKRSQKIFERIKSLKSRFQKKK